MSRPPPMDLDRVIAELMKLREAHGGATLVYIERNYIMQPVREVNFGADDDEMQAGAVLA